MESELANSYQFPSLDEITYSVHTHTHTHTPNWYTALVNTCIPCLCEVIMGALPTLISPVKNDLFILANKRISRVATPVLYDAAWANVWSLTIHCHSSWHREKLAPTFCRVPEHHMKAVDMSLLGDKGESRNHSAGNFPCHQTLHFKCSLCMLVTFAVNFAVKCFWLSLQTEL